MSVKAIRGAIQVEANSIDAIRSGVVELLPEILRANALTTNEVISVLLTATPDLTAEFPAAFAREIGFENIPLICAVEIDKPSALPRVIRVMVHVETDKEREEIKHIYLRGAIALRKDLAQ